MRIQSLLTFSILLFAGVLASCRFGLHSDISGSYQTPIEAATAGGHHWHGTASVLLTETERALSGMVVLRHPEAGTIRIPIVSGTASDPKVVFFGHTQLPLGTIDVSFDGALAGSVIIGTVDLTLHTLFGSETDTAHLRLTKDRATAQITAQPESTRGAG